MVKDLFEHIMKAREEAINRGIEANTIILNTDLAICNGFSAVFDNRIDEFPPMIFGLKIKYTNKPLPNNAAFILTRNDRKSLAEKKLDAFEVIRCKSVNVKKFQKKYCDCDEDEPWTYEEYKLGCWEECSEYLLAEDEFELLKEVL